MILGYDKFWSSYLEDIDIKSHEWPWTHDYWANEVKKNIVKMWIDGEEGEQVPQGFVAYRFVNVKDLIETGEWQGEETVIHILKLVVRPNWRNKGIGTRLLEDVEAAAKLQNVGTLAVILYEENDYGRMWLMNHGFASCILHKKLYPDGRDGYTFFKVVK